MLKKEEEKYDSEAHAGYEALRGNVEGVVYANERVKLNVSLSKTRPHFLQTLKFSLKKSSFVVVQ